MIFFFFLLVYYNFFTTCAVSLIYKNSAVWDTKCASVVAVRFSALSKVIFDYLINTQFKYTVFDYLLNSQFKYTVFDYLKNNQIWTHHFWLFSEQSNVVHCFCLY